MGLAGIAVGGRSARSRDGKAQDHHRRRVSIGDGGALRRRRVDAGVRGRGQSPRTASADIVVVDAILARWQEEDAAKHFSGVETGGVARGRSEKPAGPASL